MIGELVGNYRIVSKLGDGGMGVVYLAEHAHIGRKAAIKVLHVELCKNQEIVHRFFNEARATTQIKHPGLVDIFDFGYRQDGRAYIAMEHLDGEALLDRLKREAPFPPLVVLDIARQVAQALSAVHAKMIVHRDLKPENIFLVPSADAPGEVRVKVLDFGVAKMLAEQGHGVRTATGMLIGTPSYMSPEQCRGSSKVDHRADVYALGCVMFAMACGQPPFKGDGPTEIIVKHVSHAPPRPRSIVPSLPEELSKIILRALEKNPDDRYPSMAAMIADIDLLYRRLKAASAVTIVPVGPPAVSLLGGNPAIAANKLPVAAKSVNPPISARPVKLPGVPRERTINLDPDELIPADPEPASASAGASGGGEGLESSTVEEHPDPAFVQQILSGGLDEGATAPAGDGRGYVTALPPPAPEPLATVRTPLLPASELGGQTTTLGGAASQVMPATALPAMPSQRILIAVGLVLLLLAGATTGGLVWLHSHPEVGERTAAKPPVESRPAARPAVEKSAPPPAAPKRAPVTLTLRSNVRGTEVINAGDGKVLGVITSSRKPLVLERADPSGRLLLRFHHAGYEDQDIDFVLDQNRDIEVELQRAARSSRAKASAPKESEAQPDIKDLKSPF